MANAVDGQLRERGGGGARSQGGHAPNKFVVHLVRDAVVIKACAEGHCHHLRPTRRGSPENRDLAMPAGCRLSALTYYPKLDPVHEITVAH